MNSRFGRYAQPIELPDGEPNPFSFATIGDYTKAYVDWELAKRFAEIEARLAQIEPPETKR
jgi:hypothetical protein